MLKIILFSNKVYKDSIVFKAILYACINIYIGLFIKDYICFSLKAFNSDCTED